VFLLGIGYFLQAGLAVSQYDNLRHLPLSVPSWYFLLVGAVWGGIWLVAGIGLWRGRAWGRRLALAAIPLQFAAWLADRWLFNRSPVSLQSIGFDAGLRLALAVIGILVIARIQRSAFESTNHR
jgi:uncharacterized membrane protein (UPF0136 family)